MFLIQNNCWRSVNKSHSMTQRRFLEKALLIVDVVVDVSEADYLLVHWSFYADLLVEQTVSSCRQKIWLHERCFVRLEFRKMIMACKISMFYKLFPPLLSYCSVTLTFSGPRGFLRVNFLSIFLFLHFFISFLPKLSEPHSSPWRPNHWSTIVVTHELTLTPVAPF